VNWVDALWASKFEIALTPSLARSELPLMSQLDFPVSRRNFLKKSTAAAAVVSLPAWFSAETRSYAAAPKPRSANDRPGIALIGCGGQGRGITNWARSFGDVVAVCDVDQNNLEQAAKQFTNDGKVPAKFKDFRQLLQRDDIHVIMNGTVDHWHTLINLAAARAGKDIYSEKPLTLTIDEGKRLVREVNQQGTVFQTGSQQRSDPRFRLACELVRNGRIGSLQYMWVGLPTGPREGPFSPQPVPAHLDYDTYVGQAPWADYNGHNSHWNFRWWWRYSGGQMTDWGAHHNDIAQWGNGTDRTGPVYVDGQQLKEMIPGGYDASSDYLVRFEYANGVQMIATNQAPNGVRFEGTNGWIFVDRGQIRASNEAIIEEPLPSDAIRLYRSDNHMGNFFECIRSRKHPICDAEIGHRSISTAHLGVISVRLGRPLRWNPDKEEILGDRQANRELARPMRKPYDYSYIA
jgi:predicted dehydrogenase